MFSWVRVLALAWLRLVLGVVGRATPEGASGGGKDGRVCFSSLLWKRASLAGRLRKPYRESSGGSDIVWCDFAREWRWCSNVVSELKKKEVHHFVINSDCLPTMHDVSHSTPTCKNEVWNMFACVLCLSLFKALSSASGYQYYHVNHPQRPAMPPIKAPSHDCPGRHPSFPHTHPRTNPRSIAPPP